MEPEGSSPHSQAHANCPYPELAPWEISNPNVTEFKKELQGKHTDAGEIK